MLQQGDQIHSTSDTADAISAQPDEAETAAAAEAEAPGEDQSKASGPQLSPRASVIKQMHVTNTCNADIKHHGSTTVCSCAQLFMLIRLLPASPSSTFCSPNLLSLNPHVFWTLFCFTRMLRLSVKKTDSLSGLPVREQSSRVILKFSSWSGEAGGGEASHL